MYNICKENYTGTFIVCGSCPKVTVRLDFGVTFPVCYDAAAGQTPCSVHTCNRVVLFAFLHTCAKPLSANSVTKNLNVSDCQ